MKERRPPAAFLPPRDQWPELTPVPGIAYSAELNVSVELLDANVAAGRGNRPAIRAGSQTLSYSELLAKVEAVSASLAAAGIGHGDRVLLRLPNSAEFVIAWFAVLRRGAIAVSTMPLLRAGELKAILEDSEAKLAICHHALAGDLQKAAAEVGDVAIVTTGAAFDAWLAEGSKLPPVNTAANDIAILAYTSGTTGVPKGTIHFHRDLLATADTYSANVLRPTPDDVFSGHPTLAFTYGLGGMLLFPFRAGASTVLLEQFTPDAMLRTIRDENVSIAFCAPTTYKIFLRDHPHDLRDFLPQLRIAVSAGETLPAAVFEQWTAATGMTILDGIGSTEMLHIFISNVAGDARAGVTGKPVPGYEARIVDEHLNEVPRGTPGMLAVRGPTGCRYWNRPDAQALYVRNGWNFPADVFLQDEAGDFRYVCRSDDIILCAGYNISGIEVENVLLKHDAVSEVAVVASPDELKTYVPKAFIVLAPGHDPSDALKAELQEYVRREIAPYKYPRKIEFVSELPRTGTGKLRRSELRKRELQGAPK